ncbi:pyrroline-5-carboxylate reductase, partial [Acidiplasma cupricumulans]
MKVSIIGVGTVGRSIVTGIAKLKNYEIFLSSGSYERLKSWNNGRYNIFQSNYENAKNGDIIILSVKPSNAVKILEEIKDVANGKVIISVMAGITINLINKYLDKSPVIRVMPNIPMLVQKSVNAFCYYNLDDENKKIVLEILSSFGTPVEIKEDYIDAVTGLSGSGPGFISVMIDAMISAGVRLGIPKDTAKYLTLETFIGTASLIRELKISPSDLRDEVMTPGGTTVAGLYYLEKGNIRTAIADAVEGAYKKS